MRLIFVNRFFYPDHSATSQMLTDLAFGLADSGVSINVVTSRLSYDDPDARLPARETSNGVRIERIWTSRLGRSVLLLRSIDYLTFYLSATWALLRLVKRGDIVIAMTDPPALSVLVAAIAKIRGARLVNWLQDIFPEVAEALNVGGRLASVLFAPLRFLRNASLRHADMNVAIGELMAKRLTGLGVEASQISVVPNWADCKAIRPVARAANPFRMAWGLSGTFVIAYSGNLGRAHDIETLLNAMAATENRSRSALPMKWLFIGGGALHARLKAEAARRGLTKVDFRPYQPRERLSESLSVADVHIVSLRPELEGLIVPSKFYGVAAAGRPTLFIGARNGEIARLIARHECGIAVEPGDAAGLVDAIDAMVGGPARCRYMGVRAREMCEANFDKTRAIDAWRELLGSVARSQTSDVSEPLLDAHGKTHRAINS